MSSNEDKKSVFSYSKLLNYFKSTFFVAGVALATFVWILDPFIDVVFLQEGTNISQQVLHPDAHVAYMRSIISMGIIIFSFIVSVFFSHSKQVEEALLKSEASLKEAQHMTKIGSWELDLITNTLYWSDEVYRIFELEPQQFVATYEAFLEHIHPDDQELVDKAYADSVKNKAPYDIVHRLLLKDGTIKFINERCQTFYNDDGIAVRSVGTIQDITERKQAENALSKSEKKYRDLMEYSPDSMVIVNAKGKIELVNQQLQKMTGYTPDDLIGQAVETLIPERFKDHKQLRDSYIANPSIRTMGEGVDLFVQRKERLSLLQGDVTIKSSPGQGTSVILTAPLELSD